MIHITFLKQEIYSKRKILNYCLCLPPIESLKDYIKGKYLVNYLYYFLDNIQYEIYVSDFPKYPLEATSSI